ncbi:hypothetical protein BDN72DRAFT_847239 [Pluteus cervinus]|uniref:Uncharacterized protein n=1 Tax=Pluteus cervinus TaxID=181527 RepID=A0ACD3AD30_9AGAR|nr:hypothetical protein BDN72DRAFT_847239 [Pluteus cervinus]
MWYATKPHAFWTRFSAEKSLSRWDFQTYQTLPSDTSLATPTSWFIGCHLLCVFRLWFSLWSKPKMRVQSARDQSITVLSDLKEPLTSHPLTTPPFRGKST